MNHVDAGTFMTRIRKSFRQESDYEGWLNENVFFKTFKILLKGKQETFKGANRLRFYALDLIDINAPSDDPADKENLVS